MESLPINAWQWWFILGAILLTAEILLPGFVLAGIGFAAWCAAAAQYFTGDSTWALTAFSAGALVFFVAIRPLAVRSFMDDEPSPFGVNAMIGKTIRVTDGADIGGPMQTIFRDTTWSVRSEDDLMEGDEAEIVGVQSTTLVVRRLSRM